MWCIFQVRRLRIQHKIKSTEKGIEDVAENEEMPEYTSAIPLLAPMVCLTTSFWIIDLEVNSSQLIVEGFRALSN